jgi:hypothetical protein
MRRLLPLMFLLVACGGGGGGNSVTAPTNTTPPAPQAAITASGAGALVLHPSLDSRFQIAMVTPIRIAETAGGSADWGFARLSIIRDGREVERLELTANDIRAAGFGRIPASSNTVYNVLFRFNSEEFDAIAITLGFADVRDGRQFTASVTTGFTDVLASPTPLARTWSPNPL